MAQKPEKSFEAQHGKKPNQKLKPYLVQQYLLKNTDELLLNEMVASPDSRMATTISFILFRESFPRGVEMSK